MTDTDRDIDLNQGKKLEEIMIIVDIAMTIGVKIPTLEIEDNHTICKRVNQGRFPLIHH